MIKVSIIVPVYNVEKYLSKCLESLVHQTLKDIEILIINDGSTDNSQEIMDKYVKKYPKFIKSYAKKNGGQGSARNYGINLSKGKYIVFVDSDDYLEIDAIEKLYNKIVKEQSDIVICGNNLVAESGKILVKENVIKKSDNELINIVFGKMAVWNKIYRKKILIDNKILFRSKVWYEDLDFTMKAVFSSKKIDFLDECLYNYLLRDGSTMNNQNVEKNMDIISAFDELIEFAKQKDLYDLYFRELEILAIYHIYISTTVRVIRMNIPNNIKKNTINKINKYLIKNFPNYKSNKYIRLLDSNKKIVYFLLKFKMYQIIRVLFYLKDRRKK